MLVDGVDLISMFTIIPNIRCLHVSLYRTCTRTRMFESPLWSSAVLPHLTEFYLWTEFISLWGMTELRILLRTMPALRRLLLSIPTDNPFLLDGEQIRLLLSAVSILHLENLNYAVEYIRASLEYSTISNLRQKNGCHNQFLSHLMRNITPESYLEAKKLSVEQKLPICYGEREVIAHCCSNIPAQLSDLYTVMQKSCHVQKLSLLLSPGVQRNFFGSEEQLISISTQQQQQRRSRLISLWISGFYCHSVQLIRVLIIYGSYLRQLGVDLDCLLNGFIDVNNSNRLKSVMLHKYLVYLELDSIGESTASLEDFCRIIAFLFDTRNSLRHLSPFTNWYLKIFQSIEDKESLIKILSSFKHCTQLVSITICRDVFSDQSCNDRETTIQNAFANG